MDASNGNDAASLGATMPARADQPTSPRARLGIVALLALPALIAGTAAFAGMSAVMGDSTPAPSANVSPSVEAAPPGERSGAGDWTVAWDAIYQRSLDPSLAAALEPLASFDDGIADGALPPLANRPSPRYPMAYEVTDAIWDAVGPGWSVAVFCAPGIESVDTAGLRRLPASLYLVSPEGRYFHLWDLTEDGDDYGLALTAWINWVDVELGWIEVGHRLASIEAEYQITDVRDLRTGAILATVFNGEGDSHGTNLLIISPQSDGTPAWVDVTETDVEEGVTGLLVLNAGLPGDAQALAEVTLTPGAWLSGFGAAAAGSTTSLLEVQGFDTSSYLLADSEEGTVTAVTPRFPDDNQRCWEWTDVTPTSVDATCFEGEESYGRYRLDLQGGPPLRLFDVADPWSGDWSLPGWELVPAPDEGGTAGLDDVAGGFRTHVLDPAPFFRLYGESTPDEPVEFAPGLFLISSPNPGVVLGYDRSLHRSFTLVPARWPDTGATSALSAFVILDPKGGWSQ